MIVAVVCPKGSSAATTTAVALAASWPAGPQRVVAELDPSGGDLAARFELPLEPGMLSLVAEGRPPSVDSLARHCQHLPGGLAVLVAPTHQGEAQAVAGDASRVYAAFHGAQDVVVVADCGRVLATDVPVSVSRADLVLVVARQVPQSVPATVGVAEHARLLVGVLRRSCAVGLVVVGDRPYPPVELAAASGAELVGVVEEDPLGAALLAGRPAGRRSAARSRLLRSCAPIGQRLARRLATASPSLAAAVSVNGDR